MRLLFVVVLVIISVFPSSAVRAQEKFRFPIGESSKTLSYGPLWVAAKMGFFEKEGLDVPIVTMRGSPLTIQALTADSIYVANATVDTLINAYEKGGADIDDDRRVDQRTGVEHDWRQAIQDLRRSARHHHRFADADFRHRLRFALGAQSPRAWNIRGITSCSTSAARRIVIRRSPPGRFPPRRWVCRSISSPSNRVLTSSAISPTICPIFSSTFTSSSAPGRRRIGRWWCAS